MVNQQARLEQQFVALSNVLDRLGTWGCRRHDLHIGVVSTDLGAGPHTDIPSCELLGGDGGILGRFKGIDRGELCIGPGQRYLVDVATLGCRIDWDYSGCEHGCTQANCDLFQQENEVLTLVADQDGCPRCRNFTQTLEDTLLCLVDLGTFSGTPIIQTGDSCTGTTDYGNSTVSCTSYTASAEELLYSVVVPDGETITVTQTPIGGNTQDSSLYLLDDCADMDAVNCLAGADSTFGGEVETLNWTNTTGANMTVYIVVDAFFGCGQVQLDIDQGFFRPCSPGGRRNRRPLPAYPSNFARGIPLVQRG